jgi:hypothetical protein
MTAAPSPLEGLLGLAGAVLVFAACAAVGGLAAALATARPRLRGPRRLVVYGLLCGVFLVMGIALTRSEARAVVCGFAIVPFVVGFVMARVDLRRQAG